MRTRDNMYDQHQADLYLTQLSI